MEPEKTLLYSALVSGIEPWLAERKNDTSKTQFPDFVEKEFRGFLRCGLPQVTTEKPKVNNHPDNREKNRRKPQVGSLQQSYRKFACL